MTWQIPESLLQQYWIAKCQAYTVNGKKVLFAKANTHVDRFPDIILNKLENGFECPAEVELRTSNFNHSPEQLSDLTSKMVLSRRNTSYP